jgi:hypothetical protein
LSAPTDKLPATTNVFWGFLEGVLGRGSESAPGVQIWQYLSDKGGSTPGVRLPAAGDTATGTSEEHSAFLNDNIIDRLATKNNFLPPLMQSTLTASILLTTLAVTVSGASPAWGQQFIPPASLTPIQSEATIFKCVPYGTNRYITLVEKADKTAALFLWSRENFGGKLPPDQACNTLSQRMNDAVKQQGGNLNNLLLTMGRVNRETVICFVKNYESGCNANNTLFSLTPEDAKRYARQPHAFLEKLTGISVQGSNPPVLQLAGNPINDIDRQPYLSLEAWEKQFLKNKYDSQITRYK